MVTVQKEKTLFQLFSHQLTPDQRKNARDEFKVTRFQTPPKQILHLWSQVPPDDTQISSFLSPVKTWLEETAHQGDLVLIQGDFGATYQMVVHAFSMGLVPVYATTQRQAREKKMPDGSVQMSHVFRFKRFRIYGQ
jgi:hypothetical protein